MVVRLIRYKGDCYNDVTIRQEWSDFKSLGFQKSVNQGLLYSR